MIGRNPTNSGASSGITLPGSVSTCALTSPVGLCAPIDKPGAVLCKLLQGLHYCIHVCKAASSTAGLSMSRLCVPMHARVGVQSADFGRLHQDPLEARKSGWKQSGSWMSQPSKFTRAPCEARPLGCCTARQRATQVCVGARAVLRRERRHGVKGVWRHPPGGH